MTSAPIRLLFVDDNRLVSDALERRLALEPGLVYAGCVHTCDDAATRLEEISVDIVILDIDLPGDSFELTRALGRTHKDVKVVMFSGYVRNDYIDRAIDVGSWGYISKSESMEVVIDAFRRVAAGEFVLSPDVQAVRGMQSGTDQG